MERRLAFLLLVGLGLLIAPRSSPALDMGWGFAIANGDVNGDLMTDVSDPVCLLSFLYLGGPGPVPLAYCGAEPPSVQNGDVNGDGRRDLADCLHLLGSLFLGGPEAVSPCGAGGGAKGYVRVCPPNSKAFGKTLAQWTETYWRWSYGGGSDMVGNVKLLAIPSAPNTGGVGSYLDPAFYAGTIDIDLKPGTPFVLPEFAWIAETYEPALGIPDDPCIGDDYLITSVRNLSLKIDGVPIITDANKKDFYTPCTPFVPPVVYPAPSSYGSIGALKFQGVAFVTPPLPVGDHVIELYEEYLIQDWMGFSFGTIYDNTWNLHVKP